MKFYSWRKKALFLISALLFAQQLVAQAFTIDFREEEEVFLEQKHIALLTHVTSNYDRSELTKSSVQKVADTLKANEIVSILGVDDGATYPFSVLADRYYLSSGDTDFTLETTSGAHRLRFPKAENFILAGGNLNFCLCRTIASIMESSLLFQRSLSLFVVTDATYLTTQYSVRNSVGELEPFTSVLHAPDRDKHPSLEIAIARRDDDQVASFFRSEVFHQELGICSRNIEGPAELDLEHFRITVYHRQRPILTTGQGAQEIHLRLISSDRLPQILANWR